MAEEPTPAPAPIEPNVATTPPPAPAEPVAPAPTEPEAPKPEPAKAVAEPKPDKPTQDWRDRRIAQLTAQLAEARKTPVVAETTTPPPANIDQQVNERAAQLASIQRFNEQCLETANKGRQAFPDFDARISELRKLQDPNDNASISAYNGFLLAAIETGEGDKILHALGGDLNEAARIMSLSPVRMGIEMARMVGGDGNVVSRVPKPITPIGSRTQQHTEVDPRDPNASDRLSTAEWMRRREAQVAGTRH